RLMPSVAFFPTYGLGGSPMMHTTRRTASICGPALGVRRMRPSTIPPQKLGGSVMSKTIPHPYGWNASRPVAVQVPDTVVPLWVRVKLPPPSNDFGWTPNSPSPVRLAVSPPADVAWLASITRSYVADSLLLVVAAADTGTSAPIATTQDAK